MDHTAFIIKLVNESWNLQLKRYNNLLDSLSDDTLMKEIAPQKNRGIYILGHLLAVHDAMLPLLNFSEQLYPSYNETFISTPDVKSAHYPSIQELKSKWNEVNETLAMHFNKLSSEEWLLKHNAVSAEDFEKEPHRNRLNVLHSRTNHLSYHYGQMVLLKNTDNG